jgi:hypothetical protein
MERTVIDWVEELRGLDPLEAVETILCGLGRTRQHDVRTLAYALTAWAVLALEIRKSDRLREIDVKGKSGRRHGSAVRFPLIHISQTG